jgi:hypothetical protein
MTTTTSRRTLAGVPLIASGVFAGVGSAVLTTAFGWPAVLGESGTTALDRFLGHEQMIRFGFVLMLASSLVLVPSAFALEAAFVRLTPGTRAATAFGVAGAFFQALGWVRWPITVPRLAEAWAAAPDPATAQAVASSYDVLNGYAGGAVGEFLGWLCQGIWAVFLGLATVRAVGVPRWLGRVGLGLGTTWAVLVPAAGLLGSEALNLVGQPTYLMWYLWLIVLGGLLVVRPVGPAGSDSTKSGSGSLAAPAAA